MRRKGWAAVGVAVGILFLGLVAVNCGGGGGSATSRQETAGAADGSGDNGDAGGQASAGGGSSSADPGGSGAQGAGGTAGNQGGSSGTGSAVSDYAEEAKRIAQGLWDPAADEAEVERLLLDAFRALGLGVYDTDDQPVLEGSGSPTAGGVYLRDYEVTLLARAFLRFRDNWDSAQIPVDGILAWDGDEVGLTLRDEACQPLDLTLENVQDALQTLYGYWGLAGFTDRDYFLADLLTELERANPNKAVLPNELPSFDLLDPLQAFLIALDWLSEPLESGFEKVFSPCNLPGVQREAGRAAPGLGQALTGAWGFARGLGRVVSNVTNPVNLFRAELIVYGTKIRISGPDSPMHYRHTDDPYEGRYEFTATVEFIDDYGATLSGSLVPQKGPVPEALVRFETTDLEQHGSVLGGILGTWDPPLGLSLAWDAYTDQNGQASFGFQTRKETPIGNLDTVTRTHIWAYANPLSETYWHGQVAMLLFPIREIAHFEVGWHELVHGL